MSLRTYHLKCVVCSVCKIVLPWLKGRAEFAAGLALMHDFWAKQNLRRSVHLVQPASLTISNSPCENALSGATFHPPAHLYDKAHRSRQAAFPYHRFCFEFLKLDPCRETYLKPDGDPPLAGVLFLFSLPHSQAGWACLSQMRFAVLRMAS